MNEAIARFEWRNAHSTNLFSVLLYVFLVFQETLKL